MEQSTLGCPCMPQCPNYGKCRQCIAAHAAYYTVPKCIKQMEEEMKINHLHPSNPHMRKTLPERVGEYFLRNPNAHLRTAAEELKITHWQLLDAMDTAVSVPVSDFREIYDGLRSLDRVMVHMDTGSAVLQLTMALPEPMAHQDTLVLSSRSGDMEVTSLVFPGTLYAIFLVREQLLDGRESLSAAFVGENEKIAFSVYLRRNDQSNIEERSRALFEALWTKYKT